MPIFDYKCKNCNTVYDILHKGSEVIGDVKCPECGSDQHIKLISAPSIVTKGSSPGYCSQGACGVDRSRCEEVCGSN